MDKENSGLICLFSASIFVGVFYRCDNIFWLTYTLDYVAVITNVRLYFATAARCGVFVLHCFQRAALLAHDTVCCSRNLRYFHFTLCQCLLISRIVCAVLML